MSIRYFRHSGNPSLILPEREAVDAFRSKRLLEDRVEALETEIDTLKHRFQELVDALQHSKNRE